MPTVPAPSPDDPASLLDRARDGDRDALGALLARVGPEVARGLEIAPTWRGMLDADDVMQVTYLEAFLQFDRFDPGRGTSFEAWLSRIARNNLLDAVRGLGRRRRPQPRDRIGTAGVSGGTASSVMLLELLGATSTTPSRVAGTAEGVELLNRAIATLPEDYGRVVRLYDLEGGSIDAVAESMGRSRGAVHMLRARAHDLLRERLGSASGFFSQGA